jgi:DNA-directed RNA polymerase subunit RPC12/RpoP
MKALQYFDKKQRTIFLSVMAFALVAILLTIVFVFTNEKEEHEEPSLVVDAIGLYQYAFQSVAQQHGEFKEDTYVANLNKYLANDSMIIEDENGMLSTCVLNEFDKPYIVKYVSTEHVQLISTGEDITLGTDDDRIIDFVLTQDDDFIEIETRTNRFNACHHDRYEITIDATCTSGGERRYICKHCGAEVVKFTKPNEHSFDENNNCIICGEKNNISEGE